MIAGVIGLLTGVLISGCCFGVMQGKNKLS